MVSNLSLSQHNAGTPITRKTSKFGITYLGDASASNGVQYSSSAALQAITQPFWFACGFMRTAATTETGGAFFGGRAANNAGSAPFYNFGFQDNAGNTSNNVLALANQGGTLTSMTNTAGVVLANNSYHAVVGSFVSATQAAFFADGVEIGAGTAFTYASVNSGDPMLFYTDLGGPGGFQGNIYWFGVWKGFMSQVSATALSEPLALFNDPYQFLIYPEDEMDFDIVGVTAAVIDTAGTTIYRVQRPTWR